MSMKTETDDLFDEQFGDLLSDVDVVPETPKPKAKAPAPVTKSQAVTKVSKPAIPEAAPVAPKQEVSNDDDDVLGAPVTFGTKVSSIPIPKFKATTASKARIAILTKQVWTIKTHYVQGIGNFICMDGKCCELEGLPRVRYIFPVVQYATDKSGKIISDELELRAMSLGAEQYSALTDAISFSGKDLQNVDVVITCSDEQYQKCTFAADASKSASWKSFPGAQEIVNKWKANKNKLYMAVARKISPEVYLAKKGFVQAPNQSIGNVESLDDLLDE